MPRSNGGRRSATNSVDVAEAREAPPGFPHPPQPAADGETPLAGELARMEAVLRAQWATLVQHDPGRAGRVGQAAKFVHQAIVALQDDAIV